MILTIIGVAGTITLCVAFFKTSRSIIAKVLWLLLMFVLLAIFLLP